VVLLWIGGKDLWRPNDGGNGAAVANGLHPVFKIIFLLSEPPNEGP
jgi:hypothetical protein